MSKQQNDQLSGQDLALQEIGITRVNLNIKPRKMQEVLDEIAPQGMPAKIEQFVNAEITVHAVRFFTGQYGAAAFVVFTDQGGALYNMVMGQQVILPKLGAVRDELPVSMKIVYKEGGAFGGYYDVE